MAAQGPGHGDETGYRRVCQPRVEERSGAAHEREVGVDRRGQALPRNCRSPSQPGGQLPELAPQIYGISKYRDMYLYSEIDLTVHIQRRYKDTVVVSIVLSILGTWAALYGLYYKIYER